MVNVGHHLVQALVAAGATRFYGVPGESYLEVLDAIEQHPGAQLISTRHESGASFAAEADAKVSGQPAVAMATRAVGAANLSIGVHTAYQDSTPMIVLVGQATTGNLGREAFQEVDLPDFFRQITKHAITVHDPNRIAEYTARAVRIATSGRPGPVLLALPEDVLAVDTDPEVAGWAAPQAARRVCLGCPSAEQTTRVSSLLSAAERPVFIVGEACRGYEDDLPLLAEHYGAGVYTAFRRQDLFPSMHPNFLGHLGLEATPQIRQALDHADVVLALGTRLDEITSGGYSQPKPSSTVIQVYPSDQEIGRSVPVDLGIVADVGLCLEALLEEEPAPRKHDWSGAHAAYLAHAEVGPSRSTAMLDAAIVVKRLMEGYEGADPIVTNDAGNFSAFLHRHWVYGPKSQVAPISGAMGYGIPSAIGAKLAAPHREVLAVAGDGGFLMSGQELETAARLSLPLVAAVFRNGLYGTIAMHQARRIGRFSGVDIGQVDIAGFARSLGCLGFTVTEETELIEAVAKARAHDGPAVLDIMIDPGVLSPGMILSETTSSLKAE